MNGNAASLSQGSERAMVETVAECLLCELESSQLIVGLVPQKIRTNEGGMIRVAFSKNAKWYQLFCRAHERSYRRRNALSDTLINRSHTTAALGRLSQGNFEGRYAYRLISFIQDNPNLIKKSLHNFGENI